MDHRVVVHVDEVVGLRTVLRAGAADRHGEILCVTGRRGDGDGDAGEGRERRVVEVPGDDRADVGAAHHASEPRLIAAPRSPRARARSARAGDAWRGSCPAARGGEHRGEPGQLRVADLAVVVPGHGGVEGDDAQAVELVDAVDGAKVGILVVPQLTAERGAIVVVSHHPHHRRLQASGHGSTIARSVA
jgi:hypothetical protein